MRTTAIDLESPLSTDTDLTRVGATGDPRAELAADVRAGLTATPKSLPSKWLYDARGSALFEEITRTPEYYLTRTESALLAEHADALVGEVAPVELVEIGSGSSRKTRLLLDALGRATGTGTYVGFDVSQDVLQAALPALATDYPWLHVRGVVGDFHTHLDEIQRTGRRLVVCLGSTIGNSPPTEQVEFLAGLRSLLADDDALLVGADLVKDTDTLEAAYDDAGGVTAAFTLNLLRVLERELDAEVEPDAFRHVARWQPEQQWIAIGLLAVRPTVLRFPTLDLEVPLETGEEIRTEVSCKYTRTSLARRLDAAGLALRRFHTDAERMFALALARPSPRTRQA